jgi:hypothetical protein
LRRYFLPKRRTITELYGVIRQKRVLFIVIAVRGENVVLSNVRRDKTGSAVTRWKFLFFLLWTRGPFMLCGGRSILIRVIMFTAHIRDSPIKGKITRK